MSAKDTSTLTAADVERMVAHMNEDHADAVLAYLHHFGECPEATAGRLLDVTRHDMLIEATTSTGKRAIMIPFDRTLASAHDAHMTLISMSKQAKQALDGS